VTRSNTFGYVSILRNRDYHIERPRRKLRSSVGVLGA
jgi:hypothetical protein